jgi:hypothetical protein
VNIQVQQQPIVVQDGQLIDERNRREACKRAGVEPRVADFNGPDATAFILSMNVTRRHLSKGRRAMAVAKLYPEMGSRDRDRDKAGHFLKVGDDPTRTHKFRVADTYLRHARVVLACLPEAADAVLAGTLPPLALALQQAGVRHSDDVKVKGDRDAERARPAVR